MAVNHWDDDKDQNHEKPTMGNIIWDEAGSSARTDASAETLYVHRRVPDPENNDNFRVEWR